MLRNWPADGARAEDAAAAAEIDWLIRLIDGVRAARAALRSEEDTSELQSLMRISYAVFCLKKKKINTQNDNNTTDRKTQTNSSAINILNHTRKILTNIV